MIRRKSLLTGTADGWTVISQIEHARLAGQLAAAWRAKPATSLSFVRPEFLAAIDHHDDGWHSWERSPKFDEQGRPLNFTEMPLDDSFNIWRDSIVRCEAIGPLAAFIVAGHFLHLLRHSLVFTAKNDEGDQARAWADEFARKQSGWLADWQAIDSRHSVQVAATALSFLQSLDALSLWFCCGDLDAPYEMNSEATGKVIFSPVSQRTVTVQPWPFGESGWQLSIRAEKKPSSREADGQGAAASGPEIPEHLTLEWRLQPA